MISGCANNTETPPKPTYTSDGKVVSELSTFDIYKAYVAFCSGEDIFNSVTKFVGNDRTLSPEKRNAEKEEAWEKWQTDISSVRKEMQGKIFKVEIPARFGNYNKNENKMQLITYSFDIFDRRTDDRTYSMYGSIPESFVFNSSNGSHFLSPIPSSIPPNMQHVWPYNTYSRFRSYSHSRIPNVYIINRTFSPNKFAKSDSGYSRISGKYGGEIKSEMLGVFVDTSELTSNQNSPFIRVSSNYVHNNKLHLGIVYLDLNKFNFVDSFGVYPDTGSVDVNVEYLFEIKSCDRLPQGKLKEVIISVRPIPNEVSSDNEILRVTF